MKIVSYVGFVQVAATPVELTPSNFDSTLSSGNWLVKFYAPWCGYCRQLEPVYNEVSSQLEHNNVKLAKVDASKYKGQRELSHAIVYQLSNLPSVSSALGFRFGVDGFPSIF